MPDDCSEVQALDDPMEQWEALEKASGSKGCSYCGGAGPSRGRLPQAALRHAREGAQEQGLLWLRRLQRRDVGWGCAGSMTQQQAWSLQGSSHDCIAKLLLLNTASSMVEYFREQHQV